nr:Biomphalaria glabrata cell wall protein RBR3-like [Biomphalaria glabrata]
MFKPRFISRSLDHDQILDTQVYHWERKVDMRMRRSIFSSWEKRMKTYVDLQCTKNKAFKIRVGSALK